MVAYSFKSRFAQLIAEGRKCQTIRAERQRHARPGEPIQLFVGMRTKHCRKIIADPICEAVQDVAIFIGRHGLINILINGLWLSEDERVTFVRADGFADVADFHDFWMTEHGEGWFHGVLVRWSRPLPMPSSALRAPSPMASATGEGE